MECLILRLDAPLMSFGGVVVDQHHPTGRFPGVAMLAGLLGNALGWDHRDSEKLQRLQDRLRFAARWDAEPEPLLDYQTVDLGQDFLVDTGWTTRGRREDRKGGSAATGTHIRYRHHWANGVMTVALALHGSGAPTLEDLEHALQTPARPLFIGRKPCLPAAPLCIGRREAQGVKAALAAEPLADIAPRRRPNKMVAIWPLDEGEAAMVEERFDARDWSNNTHLGSRRYAVGTLEVAP
jgi:CRISPR system Cascade subunit CasD